MRMTKARNTLAGDEQMRQYDNFNACPAAWISLIFETQMANVFEFGRRYV